MEHDEEEDIMPSSYSLEDLLEYLRLHDRSSSNIKYSGFQFYNTILTKSQLTGSMDFFLWTIFYIFLEVIISSTSLQTRIFSDLNPIFVEANTQSTNSLFSKVLAQLSTVCLFILTILIIIFQIPVSSQKSTVGHLKATFLHLSLIHLPMILTPAYGILFGCHIMSTAGTEANDHSGTYYALLVAVSFIAIACSTYLFTSTTWNKLTITNHPFEYWEFPYGFIDLVFFFLLGTFFPIRNSYYEKAIIAMEVIQFIYGWYFLLKRRQHSFIYLTPNFIEAKIGIDCITFSFVGMINLFFNISQLSKLGFVFVAHFIGMIFAAIFVSRNKVLGTSILKHRSFTVDRRWITSSLDAATMIRSGLMLTIPTVADFKFITWIASCRFSPKILPDLYRICLVLKRPLKSVKIPVTAFGSMDVVSYQFLAFQVDSYLQMIDEESSAVQAAVEHLNILNEKIESILNKFWTTEDYDQITIYKLGYNIFNAKSQYDEALFNFPLSQKIHEIHKKFAIDILKMPKFIAEEHKNPYFYIAYPKKTIYSFLADKSKNLPHFETRPKLTANEKTADNMIRKGSKTLITFFRIMVFLTFVFTFALWIIYYNSINNTWSYFINVTQYQRANIAMATDVLLATDKLMKFPDAQMIQMIIGVPLEAAALFRAPITLDTRYRQTYDTILYSIPAATGKFPIQNISCNKISFSSLISLDIDEDTSIEHRRCYLMNNLLQMEMIENLSEETINKFEMITKDKYNTVTIIQFVTSAIIFVIFGVLFYLLRVNHAKLLSAIRLVLSSKPNYHENEYLDIQFWLFPTLALIVFSIAGTIGMFISFVSASTENDRFIRRIINETVSISHIVIGLEIGLALTEYSVQDNIYRKEYENLTLMSCIEVYYSVNNLTTNNFISNFQHIPPIYNWTLPNRMSYSTVLLDICRLMLQGNHSEESFDFLAARAFFMYNVSILTSETLPQMYESSHYAMLMAPSHFWWISMAIIIITILLHIIYIRFFYKRMRMWFKAALIILLRNSTGDLKNLIESKKVSLPDLAPFPILITNKKTNMIMYANPATTKYTNLSIGQLIGQELNNVWPIDSNNTFSINGRRVEISETDVNTNYNNENRGSSNGDDSSMNDDNEIDFQNYELSDLDSNTDESHFNSNNNYEFNNNDNNNNNFGYANNNKSNNNSNNIKYNNSNDSFNNNNNNDGTSNNDNNNYRFSNNNDNFSLSSSNNNNNNNDNNNSNNNNDNYRYNNNGNRRRSRQNSTIHRHTHISTNLRNNHEDLDDDELSMILFNDVTEIRKIEEKCKNLIKQTRINKISLPIALDMISLEIRIDADVVNTDKIFEIYSNCEGKCPCLVRVSCGPSFYNGFAYSDCDFKLIIKFIYQLMKEINDLPPPKVQPVRTSFPGKIFSFNQFKPPPILNSNPIQPAQKNTFSSFNIDNKTPFSPLFNSKPPLIQNLNDQQKVNPDENQKLNSNVPLTKSSSSEFSGVLNLNVPSNHNPHFSISPLQPPIEPTKQEDSTLEKPKDSNFSHVIVSVIHSIGKVISLCGNNTVGLVCGKAAQRSHDCVLNGSWGRIYIDFDLMDMIDLKNKYLELKDKIIQISDLLPPEDI